MEEEINPDVAQEAVKRWIAGINVTIADKNERLAGMSPASENFALRYASLQGHRDAFCEARRLLQDLLQDLQYQPHKGE